eukprot:3902966-Rhodomonas_salina.1
MQFIYNTASAVEQMGQRDGPNVIMHGLQDYEYTQDPTNSVTGISKRQIDSLDDNTISLATIHVKFVNVFDNSPHLDQKIKLPLRYVIVIVQTPAPINIRHAVCDNLNVKVGRLMLNPDDCEKRTTVWKNLYRHALSFYTKNNMDIQTSKSTVFTTPGSRNFSCVFSIARALFNIQTHAAALSNIADANCIEVGGFGTVRSADFKRCIESICVFECEWDTACKRYAELNSKGESTDFIPSQLPPVNQTLPTPFQVQNDDPMARLPKTLVNMVYHGLRRGLSNTRVETFELVLPAAAYTALIADSLGARVELIGQPLPNASDFVDNDRYDNTIQGLHAVEKTVKMLGRENAHVYTSLMECVFESPAGVERMEKFRQTSEIIVFQASTNVDCLGGYRYTELNDKLAFWRQSDPAATDTRSFVSTMMETPTMQNFIHNLGDIESHELYFSGLVSETQGGLLKDAITFSHVNSVSMGLFPENLHVLHAAIYNQYISMFDITKRGFQDVRMGLGGAIWLCDGGGAYRQCDESKQVPKFDKRNGS